MADVQARAADIGRLARELDPDVLVVQEVTSKAIAGALAQAIGSGYHVACSDFTQGDAGNHGALEVAVFSRLPIDQFIEYDVMPDNGAGDPDEAALFPPSLPGLSLTPRPARGFLWARIDALGLTVTAVHLKSSRGASGQADYRNSQSREYVAAPVAASVNKDLGLYPDYTVLVAGDFNVAHADARKNGEDLTSDDPSDPNAPDGYDETHALLWGGLVSGLEMTNLSAGISQSSYPSFPQNSPIDNIDVAGDGAGSFAPAQLSSETFGSEHLAVATTYTPATPPGPEFLAGASVPERADAAEPGAAAELVGKRVRVRVGGARDPDHTGTVKRVGGGWLVLSVDEGEAAKPGCY